MKSANNPNRRELLGALGAIGVVGMSSEASAAAGESFITTKTDRQEYARLRDLDLDDPKVLESGKKMPTGKIGDITFGRLMSGSNLISMNMHARDLDYVGALAAGTISAKDGITYAFESGADFICLGMFDWQVTQDVDIAIKAVEKSKNRKRPWM